LQITLYGLITCVKHKRHEVTAGDSRNLVIQCSPKRSKSLILQAFREVIITYNYRIKKKIIFALNLALRIFSEMPHFVRRDIFALAKVILRFWRSNIIFASLTAARQYRSAESRISLRSNITHRKANITRRRLQKQSSNKHT